MFALKIDINLHLNICYLTLFTISNYLFDTFLVDNIRKNERASAVAAKKKIKELSLIL